MTREERIKLIRHLKYNRSIGADYMITDKDADEIIKALEQEPILDRVRAEIANHCGVNTDYCDSCRFCTDSMEVREILQIIDKYKAKSEGNGMSIDQLITQIANTMNLSEAEVRMEFDNITNPSQPYVPTQGFCKNSKCSEYDAVIRKRIRNRMRRIYKAESEN